MTTAAIVQARMGSTRLPGKVLAPLADRPVLDWVVAAARRIPGVDQVIVATSVADADAAIADWCAANDVACHRGPEQDVLRRFAEAATGAGADTILRLTADCPFLDPQVCGAVLALLRRSGADYATNAEPASWPDGLDCEAFTTAALTRADRDAGAAGDREHVTPYIRHGRGQFSVRTLPCPLPGLSHERWTLDTPADLDFLSAVAARLPAGRPASHIDVLRVLDDNPELRDINAGQIRNAGGANALEPAVPAAPRPSYARSAAMLERAEKVIPLGSQTFSKSHIQMPEGAAPLFLSHGRGGRVWDVDGNRYVDLVCGLLPVVLGYCDPDVDQAIRAQLDNGISFSLATELESALAERLVEIIPCAEMVRFGKNGTDATSAAIRLARAFTGRDRIAVCGYHGWQDWYVGATTRDKGVPAAVSALTHRFPDNDTAALDRLLRQHPNEFAAVILEPVTGQTASGAYLETVRDITHRHGAVLVFDEVITGFRFALGGAQAWLGVTPDLASFGKAMGNGMPISAIVGRADIMAEMEQVFLSGTFGGEALSLAASIAVIDKMRREPVIERLWQTGERLAAEVRGLIARHRLDDVVSLVGQPPWTLLSIRDHPRARGAAIKTMFKREMFANGVLIGGSHNICHAHDDTDIAVVARAYDRTLARIAGALDGDRLEADLGCPVIEPVFSVRTQP